MEPDPGTQEKNDMASPVVERQPVLPGHESMVTVRLSEPIGLTVNTNIPPNIMLSRRSLGPEHTPTSATPSTKLGLGLKSPTDDSDMRLSPITPNAKNLLEELREEEGEDAAKEEPDAKRASASGDSVDENEEFEEEEVDWEKLQKSEDEQAQKDDNVRVLTPSARPGGARIPLPLLLHRMTDTRFSRPVDCHASCAARGGEQQAGIKPKGCEG